MKKCAHCGGRGTYVTDIINTWRYHFVQCVKCRSSTGGYETKEEAKEAWDMRYEELSLLQG